MYTVSAFLVLFFTVAMVKKPLFTVPEDSLVHLSSREDCARGVFVNTAYSRERSGIELLFTEGSYAPEGSFTSPPLSAGFPIKEIIPSWNVETPGGGGSMVEIRLSREGEHWSPWFRAGCWGSIPATAGKKINKNEWGELKVDYLSVRRDASYAQVRVTLFSKAEMVSPLVTGITLAMSSEHGDLDLSLRRPLSAPFTPRPLNLKVPYRSQRDEDSSIAGHVCSTTSVSMVMEYWGVKKSTAEMAALIYEPETGLYGIWWRAVQGASLFGFQGWVQYFRNWQEVYRELSLGNPVIACISCGEGCLTGSPTSSSEGHVIVIRGVDDRGNPLCNDPAGKDEKDGIITYHREELARAWFDRGGVGYLIIPRKKQGGL